MLVKCSSLPSVVVLVVVLGALVRQQPIDSQPPGPLFPPTRGPGCTPAWEAERPGTRASGLGTHTCTHPLYHPRTHTNMHYCEHLFNDVMCLTSEGSRGKGETRGSVCGPSNVHRYVYPGTVLYSNVLYTRIYYMTTDYCEYMPYNRVQLKRLGVSLATEEVCI